MVREHPFFRQLMSLSLPIEDYVIAGSGPMFAHGLRRDIGDIDVVAGSVAWGRALELGHPETAPLGYAQHVVLSGGTIEILDGWFGYPVDALIAEAEIIEGIRFMPLRRVLEWKLKFMDNGVGREKDWRDIEMIRQYLQ
ncbi:hypothetical protein [Streptomyces lavenduligriseus]|uniref:Nucleotidyltransferase family protein n=1 Tax=Streptomyces lavenduligriseus TaxID=67315 RepID=A0ABT0NN94_9ACTN|nr:hypothetical protein [Streptomyces lavenduligriseus]MCL3992841.1 hypothetical protein [Streptomyces lavenduligriseus]